MEAVRIYQRHCYLFVLTWIDYADSRRTKLLRSELKMTFRFDKLQTALKLHQIYLPEAGLQKEATLFLGFSRASIANRDKMRYAMILENGPPYKGTGWTMIKEQAKRSKIRKSSFSRDVTDVFGAFVASSKFLSDDNFAMPYPCARNCFSLFPDNIKVLVLCQDTSASTHHFIDMFIHTQNNPENVKA